MLRLAIVGYGETAQARHLPAIAATPGIELVAIVGPEGGQDGIPWFPTFDSLLGSDTDFAAVALCLPPPICARYAALALDSGRHVLFDAPPVATVAEMSALSDVAAGAGLTLFAPWRARYTNAVAHTRTLVAAGGVTAIRVAWFGKTPAQRLSPCHDHDGAWRPGGLGVLDFCIGALSILTDIVPEPLTVTAAELSVPGEREPPVAATLHLSAPSGLSVEAAFDLRPGREDQWDVDLHAPAGIFALSNAGKILTMGGRIIADGLVHEYQDIYRRFLDLVQAGASDVDTAPLAQIAAALSLGRRTVVPPVEH